MSGNEPVAGQEDGRPSLEELVTKIENSPLGPLLRDDRGSQSDVVRLHDA